MYKFSRTSKIRLNEVHEDLRNLMQLALEESPIDFGIPEYGGIRTAEEQKELYDRGKSRCDGVKNKSYHQSGKAIDVYAYINGRASWDDVHLALIAGVVFSQARELGLNIRWGGTFGSNEFKGWDKPHFELN